MLALAHKIQDTIDRGMVANQAEVAELLRIRRARVTHLLGLTLLAPEIQERVLLSEAVDGVEPWTERGLRAVGRCGDWGVQRRVWQN